MKYFKLTVSTAIMLAAMAQSLQAASFQHHINIKTGSFTLNKPDQTISDYYSSTPITFDDESSSVLGVGYEFEFNNGVSIGGEMVLYSNDYTDGFSVGSADSALFMFNARKYFSPSDYIKPYIGIGIGVAGVDMTGPVWLSGAGLATQFMAGVRFPFQGFSALIEYKSVSAKPEDDYYYYYNSSVDISGKGLFGGVSVDF